MEEKNENARVTALTLILEGIRAADPEKAIKNYVSVTEDKILLKDGTSIELPSKIYVVGGGKATGGMAKAIEEIFGEKISKGLISVPEDIVDQVRENLLIIEVVGATHPKASEKSVEAGKKIVDVAKQADEDTLLITLISGGGSALMEYPAEGVTIQDIGEISIQLMKAGADIFELNTVRKHLSRFKGGWLAKHAYPAKVLTLMISDVVGDRMDTIASGPTVPDPTTFKDAWYILEKYSLTEKAPKNAVEYIKKGLKGEVPETPKPGDKVFDKVFNRIVASNIISLQAMKNKAASMGYNVTILTSMIEGEAREVGKVVASIAKEIQKTGNPIPSPAVVLMGGETTVTVRGSGKGGRNQELALSASIQIKGIEGVAIASVGSDGRDGPTDVAGAIVDGTSVLKAEKLGLDPEKFLADNNSYGFFEKVGGHVKTGYTGTNVNDLIVIVVEK
ncbi:MAG: glycerate kinase [Thermoprotei archaeon]|nr:MAG: glycerate kinase [Thermoprotei archaeon]